MQTSILFWNRFFLLHSREFLKKYLLEWSCHSEYSNCPLARIAAGAETSAPLASGIIYNALSYSGPHINQTLPRIIHILHYPSGRRVTELRPRRLKWGHEISMTTEHEQAYTWRIIVSKMTDNVLIGTLNPTHSLTHAANLAMRLLAPRKWGIRRLILLVPRSGAATDKPLCYMHNEKNARRRRKHCALAVVRRSQKFSPRRRPPFRGRGTARI